MIETAIVEKRNETLILSIGTLVPIPLRLRGWPFLLTDVGTSAIFITFGLFIHHGFYISRLSLFTVTMNSVYKRTFCFEEGSVKHIPRAYC